MTAGAHTDSAETKSVAPLTPVNEPHVARPVNLPDVGPPASASPSRASDAVPHAQDLTESLLSGIIIMELALSILECQLRA